MDNNFFFSLARFETSQTLTINIHNNKPDVQTNQLWSNQICDVDRSQLLVDRCSSIPLTVLLHIIQKTLEWPDYCVYFFLKFKQANKHIMFFHSINCHFLLTFICLITMIGNLSHPNGVALVKAFKCYVCDSKTDIECIEELPNNSKLTPKDCNNITGAKYCIKTTNFYAGKFL